MEADRWQEAEGLLDRAVAACPIDPDARRYYCRKPFYKRGASAEALSQLEEAIRLTPNDTLLVIRPVNSVTRWVIISKLVAGQPRQLILPLHQQMAGL